MPSTHRHAHPYTRLQYILCTHTPTHTYIYMVNCLSMHIIDAINYNRGINEIHEYMQCPVSKMWPPHDLSNNTRPLTIWIRQYSPIMQDILLVLSWVCGMTSAPVINKLIHLHRDYPQHDDVIKWIHFAPYWPFMQKIHWSPVNSPHKGQWHGALMFSLIYVWINAWVNNRDAGDLRRHCAHYDVIVVNF